MGLKTYEQEIAVAAAHPDREHAVTVLRSLARSLRRHEWPPERRAAAYDLALYAEATARRMIADGARGPLEESAATCRHPAASIKRPALALLWCRSCGALATTGGGAVLFERVISPPPGNSAWLRPSVYTGPCVGDEPTEDDRATTDRAALVAEQLFEAARREQPHSSVTGWGELTSNQQEYWRRLADQDRGAAQEIYPFAGHEIYCHRCDLTVPAGEVVEPQP